MSFAHLNYGSALSGLGHARQQAALNDFQNARQQAALQEILARLTGKSNQLLSYEEIARKLHLRERVERGLQEIPVNAIVGSVGRYSDFTRTFLPRHDSDKQRWARVGSALASEGRSALPPIDVYKVGEVYFVLDGNHRVSAARQLGLTHLDAHVIEMRTKVPLTPNTSPDELIIKAEYADFLEQTGLKDFCDLFDLSLTVPGQYEKLRQHIEIVRASLEEKQSQAVSYSEAAQAWYEAVYLPTALAIRERGLLRWLPGRTETDLYLWITEHRQALEDELGWAVRPEAAITDLVVRSQLAASTLVASGSWRQGKLTERYTSQLFKDILVPLHGTPDTWAALDQALLIARHEQARLYGLHILTAESQPSTETILPLRIEFKQRCEAAGVEGSLVVEAGEVARKILERAPLADLVVLSLAHPPEQGLPSLSSGLRTIIWKSARPLLTVPSKARPFRRALLTYDGSPKAKEALFVATYLAEQWQTSLTVMTLTDNTVTSSILTYARDYLNWHEIEAEFIATPGTVETFLKFASERDLDLILMGGYSVSPLAEVMGGSAVNYMLRDARCPLFICQ